MDKYTLAKQTNKMGDSNNKEKRTVLIVFFPKMEKVIISIVCDYFQQYFEFFFSKLFFFLFLFLTFPLLDFFLHCLFVSVEFLVIFE